MKCFMSRKCSFPGPLPPHRQRGPHHEEVHPFVAGQDRQGRKGVRAGEISKVSLIIISLIVSFVKQECVSEFISFITSEASDRCQVSSKTCFFGVLLIRIAAIPNKIFFFWTMKLPTTAPRVSMFLCHKKSSFSFSQRHY